MGDTRRSKGNGSLKTIPLHILFSNWHFPRWLHFCTSLRVSANGSHLQGAWNSLQHIGVHKLIFSENNTPMELVTCAHSYGTVCGCILRFHVFAESFELMHICSLWIYCDAKQSFFFFVYVRVCVCTWHSNCVVARHGRTALYFHFFDYYLLVFFLMQCVIFSVRLQLMESKGATCCGLFFV